VTSGARAKQARASSHAYSPPAAPRCVSAGGALTTTDESATPPSSILGNAARNTVLAWRTRF
jgi:hypothetical protein